MPRSAIATGAADHVVAVAEMPDIITNYVRHPFIQNGVAKKVLGENAKGSLEQIIAVLKAHSPINFDLYKDGTLLRRIERRMALRHMENSGDYLALLKDSAEEAQNLCADLLISVTSFFRDPEAFDYLEKTVLEELVKSHDAGHPVRIWVPGCATGEEAYSLAMLVIEKISTLRKDVKLQVFASDVDERALTDRAQRRLSGFHCRRCLSCTPEAVFHQRRPQLPRDAGIARCGCLCQPEHSGGCAVLETGPDLVPQSDDLSDARCARAVIQMFHFALNDGGHLFLGMSETTRQSRHPL